MTDPNSHKPPPARPGAGKPIPVRELTGERTAESPAQPAESDIADAQVDVEGTRWTVRVLGRSGRASGATAHLLLLGFWEGDAVGDEPSLEAMVAGRTLQGVSTEALEAALSGARKPGASDRKRGFFQDASQARRR
jgi:hypothetical protein